MIEEGVECVLKWNENRKLDIFSKKTIMLPINLKSHWSSFVVVNMHNLPTFLLGSMELELDIELPVMMLFDSLGLHDSNSSASYIWKWLLYEWTTKSW
jgi:Ulp1 family protease